MHKGRSFIRACGFAATVAALFSGVAGASPSARHELQEERREASMTKILDLSRPFKRASLYNNNNCASRMINLASKEPEVRAMVVLEHGKIVAEYYKEEIFNEKTRSHIWSCTKAWTNLLLGVMLKEKLLSLNDTLGDIFAEDSYKEFWDDIPDAENRKALTIESIITMTAGLSVPL